MTTKRVHAWDRTKSRHARGYGAAWTRLRAQILERDCYLCQVCAKAGKVRAASAVDHIKPKADGGTDDPRNLQSICDPCHDAKTIIDRGHEQRAEIGADGWPIGPGGVR